MLKRTTSDLREVIAKIAVQKKLSVVIGAATVAYAEKSVDITADVLRALGVDPNAPDPVDAPAPAVGPVDIKIKKDAKP